LILEPQEYGHTGHISIDIRNTTTEPLDSGINLTEAVAGTMGQVVGASGCGINELADHRRTFLCGLDPAIAPGETGSITVDFQSPASPQPFAQIAPAKGSVEVGGVTAEFPALFRATTGSLLDPQPYVQDTTASLTVTASDVTLTRQEDGTFAGSVPVTVRNDGDAPHVELWAELSTPAGIDSWPGIEGGGVCVGGDVEAGFQIGCDLLGGQLAEGQERTFTWLLRAPAEAVSGPLGTGTTTVKLTNPELEQGAPTNVDSFAITVA
jgi:hypothetical protein